MGLGHLQRLPTFGSPCGALGCGQCWAVKPQPERGTSAWAISLNNSPLLWSKTVACVHVILTCASWLSLEQPYCPPFPAPLHPERASLLSCSQLDCPELTCNHKPYSSPVCVCTFLFIVFLILLTFY